MAAVIPSGWSVSPPYGPDTIWGTDAAPDPDPISDATSDVLGHIMVTMGLRPRRVLAHGFSETVGGKLVYRSERVGRAILHVPMDHCEAWGRGRGWASRTVLLVGHNYRGYPADGPTQPILALQRPSWRELPRGVSWYYPRSATALLQWLPEVDDELAPFLDRRFGPAVVE